MDIRKHGRKLIGHRRNKFIFIPTLLMVGILLFLILNKPPAQSTATPKRVASTPQAANDQKLTTEGLELVTVILPIEESVGGIKKYKSGDDVKVLVKLKNSSQQQSRFLTIKTGLKSDNFLYMRNFKGLTGITKKEDEIAFSNVVMNPGQVQEMGFEATIFSSKDYEFEVKPTLIDITNQIVLHGQGSKYSIAKTDAAIGGATQTNKEKEW